MSIDLKTIPKLLEEYSILLESLPSKLAIRGKTLKISNTEQSEILWQYDSKRQEVNHIVRMLNVEVEKIRSKLTKKYTETYSRELNDRTIDKYIDAESAYLDQMEIYLSVKEIADKFEAAVEAIRARGYALKNVTELTVQQMLEQMIN